MQLQSARLGWPAACQNCLHSTQELARVPVCGGAPKQFRQAQAGILRISTRRGLKGIVSRNVVDPKIC